MLEIEAAGVRLGLLAERGLWWPDTKTLIIADVHWGKSGHFRKHGIAIPAGTQTADELRLAGLVRQYQAERLIVAGDLFHSTHNPEVDAFTHWRNNHQALHIDFVKGNHDILPTAAYDRWKLMVHTEQYDAGPFIIAHDDVSTSKFLLHGHIHPGVRLNGLGRQTIARPCFCMDSRRMILPAFGKFTGCHYLDLTPFAQVFAVGETSVIPL